MGLLSGHRASKSSQAAQSANKGWKAETSEIAMVRVPLSKVCNKLTINSVTVVHDDLHWSNNHRNTLQTALAVRGACFHQTSNQMDGMGGLGPFEINMDQMGPGLAPGMAMGMGMFGVSKRKRIPSFD